MAKRIKYWLKIRNMSMRALAQTLHMSAGWLSHLIHTDSVQPDLLERISKVLRVPVEQLRGT